MNLKSIYLVFILVLLSVFIIEPAIPETLPLEVQELLKKGLFNYEPTEPTDYPYYRFKINLSRKGNTTTQTAFVYWRGQWSSASIIQSELHSIKKFQSLKNIKLENYHGEKYPASCNIG